MGMMKGKNPKQELSLIYFSSCPNYEPIKKMLQEIGLIFKEINQDNLQEGDFGKNFTSPTLIMNTDNIIWMGEKQPPPEVDTPLFVAHNNENHIFQPSRLKNPFKSMLEDELLKKKNKGK